MKKRLLKMLVFVYTFVLFISLCSCKCNERNSGINEIIDNTEIDLFKNNNSIEIMNSCDDIFNDEIEEPNDNHKIVNDCNPIIDYETNIEDKSFDSFVKNNVKLFADEEIENLEWIEDKVCYRVSIKRTHDTKGEYTHLRDYIFVNEGNDYTFINVTYPLRDDSMDSDRYVYGLCEFTVSYVDITFDGEKDIVISLGYSGTKSIAVNCAYVNVDGEFIYVKSFEDIPNYSINEQEKCIDGWFEDDEYKFIYANGQFVELNDAKTYEN